MDLKFYIDKRIVLKDCIHKETQGKTCIITDAIRNDSKDIILCTDLPHPEDNNFFLWINTNQIAYIKQFDSVVYVYEDKTNNQNLCLNFEIESEDIKRIGCFDVYIKLFPPFSLTKH